MATLLAASLLALSGCGEHGPPAEKKVPRSTPPEVAEEQPQFHSTPIRQLAAREFERLPRPIVRALEANGCTIPQTWLFDERGNRLYKTPHNVVSGSFRRAGQIDWAVLCSHHDSSAIVIFWGGSESDTTVLQRSPDEGWTQDVDGRGNLGYSRLLGVASPKRILNHNPDVGPQTRSPALHDGIEDYFVEKGSTIYYIDKGRALELEGSD